MLVPSGYAEALFNRPRLHDWFVLIGLPWLYGRTFPPPCQDQRGTTNESMALLVQNILHFA